MRKQTRHQAADADAGASRLERTTVFFPTAMLRNLDLLAQRTGTVKSEILRRILYNHLKAEGLEPDRVPVVKIDHRNP